MRKLGIQAAILALVIAPLAAHAAETARPNPKLPEAVTAAPLVPKAATSEARMSYACVFGQAGGAALSLMLGSSRFWDALNNAPSARWERRWHPMSLPQRKVLRRSYWPARNARQKPRRK
jgi:hypothetical protein